MKGRGFGSKSREPEEERAPVKAIKSKGKAMTVLDRDRAKPGQERCPFFFDQHGTHARQQCTRGAGHHGHHHCAGAKCEA